MRIDSTYFFPLVVTTAVGTGFLGLVSADPVDDADRARIEMIQRLTPTVVCMYDAQQRGGGSGVIIDAEGIGLTNFHVIAGMLDKRRGLAGLSDGRLLGFEVLGVDPTGDVAMFRLLGGGTFSAAPMGDSDALRLGQTAIAMGNAFVLSEDYTPTVTAGIITGLHRYQEGTKGNLVYSDCIQVDASINPGNSGGPLFNETGEVIGINGRISVSVRGRLNVGLGYAIAVNQIKRFIPAMRAGLMAKHGGLGATVDSKGEWVHFDAVAPDSVAHRAGIAIGDRILSFDGIPIASRNHFTSLLGTYPADWPVSLEIQQQGANNLVSLRLEPVEPALREAFAPDPEINAREVRRVLKEFRDFVLGSINAAPNEWKWKIVRARRVESDPDRAVIERYDATMEGDGPVAMGRKFDDGSSGAKVSYDHRSATRRTGADPEPVTLPVDEQMTLSALYVFQKLMLKDPAYADLGGVRHVGADRWTPFHTVIEQNAGHAPGGEWGVRRNPPDRILEGIQWPMAEHIDARFGFDPETHGLVRIRVRDIPSGIEVQIDVGDYKDVGGLTLPNSIHVIGPGYAYQESRSDWELQP